MKFIDDILHTATEQVKRQVEEVTMEKILDGDITFAEKDGTIQDAEGRVIAHLSMDLDKDFSPRWKLRVPTDKWEHIQIVCDGNAMDLNTAPLSDGRYIVRRTLRGFQPTTVVEETELELPEFETTKEFLNWIESQTTDTIEALRQIYYDRWNFDTASQRDRMYYELLEEEKKGRK